MTASQAASETTGGVMRVSTECLEIPCRIELGFDGIVQAEHQSGSSPSIRPGRVNGSC
ncbi:MAG: hypothetical protein ACU841_01070 [Gammaproteobacteria bacterium]